VESLLGEKTAGCLQVAKCQTQTEKYKAKYQLSCTQKQVGLFVFLVTDDLQFLN